MSLYFPRHTDHFDGFLRVMERRDFDPPQQPDIDPLFRSASAKLQKSLLLRFIQDDRRQALGILHDEMASNKTANAILNMILQQDDAELGRIVRLAFADAAADAIDERASKEIE